MLGFNVVFPKERAGLVSVGDVIIVRDLLGVVTNKFVDTKLGDDYRVLFIQYFGIGKVKKRVGSKIEKGQAVWINLSNLQEGVCSLVSTAISGGRYRLVGYALEDADFDENIVKVFIVGFMPTILEPISSIENLKI